MHHEKLIDDSDLARINSWYNEYINNAKPLEYIIWHVAFLGVQFTVNQHTLIPRPETEYMLLAIKEWLTTCKKQPQWLYDIWTWCWVLGLSVLYHNPNIFTDALMSDISPDALDVAQSNKELVLWDTHATNISFFIADLLAHESFITHWKWAAKAEAGVLIVANLPYIPNDLFDENTDRSVHDHEPKIAFVWWDDWLDWYRIMFDQLLRMYQQSPVHHTQFLEMMTRQIWVLEQEYWAFYHFEAVKTFHFNIKIVKVTRKK